MSTQSEVIAIYSKTDYLGQDATARYLAEVRQIITWNDSRELLARSERLLPECDREIEAAEKRAGELAEVLAAKEQRLNEAKAAVSDALKRGVALNKPREFADLETAQEAAEGEYREARRRVETGNNDLASARRRAQMTRSAMRKLADMTPPETPLIDLVRNYKGGK